MQIHAKAIFKDVEIGIAPSIVMMAPMIIVFKLLGTAAIVKNCPLSWERLLPSLRFVVKATLS